MTVGERIRFYAKRRYGTLQAFARAAGINVQQLSGYTTDHAMPSVEVLQRFASAGINVHWLICGDGEMDARPEQVAIAQIRTSEERLDEIERLARRILSLTEQ